MGKILEGTINRGGIKPPATIQNPPPPPRPIKPNGNKY
jgi:hypothetical protein